MPTTADLIEQLSLETVITKISDGILTVTVTRPRALNALSPQVIAELRELVGVLRENLGETSTAKDWSVRGLILIGDGEKAFIAGADISVMKEMSPRESAAYAAEADELTLWIEELPVPVVAAVNGYALGGGLELAMAADIIFASENAVFGQPEVGLGLIPGFGGCVRLQQWVGAARARDLILTGRHIQSGDAASWGLVAEVVRDRAELVQRAEDFLSLTQKQSPVAVAAAKRTIRAVSTLTTVEGLKTEQSAFAACFETDDMREGTAAFVEKRRPAFPSVS